VYTCDTSGTLLRVAAADSIIMMMMRMIMSASGMQQSRLALEDVGIAGCP